MNEKSNPGKRREWVKNAAIIFLSVMLVLTFFSNTIMNYSLPEVATEYVQSGTITEKVRGTGVIEASDPYNVTIEESRVIESVVVKEGDEVKKDDILFYLADEESTELADAEKELNTLILAYQVAVITESLGVGTVNNIERDNTLSLPQKQQKLQSSIATLDAAQAELDQANLQVAAINKELGYIGNTIVDTSSEKGALTNAQKEASNAGQAVTDAQSKVTLASADIETAKANVTAKKAEVEAANADVAAMNAYKATVDNYAAKAEELQAAKAKADQKVTDVENAYNSWVSSNPAAGPADLEEQMKPVDTAKAEQQAAADAIQALDSEYQTATANFNQGTLDSLIATAAAKENELAAAQQAVIEAEQRKATANSEVADKQQQQSDKNKAVNEAQQALENKTNSLQTDINKANASNRLLEAQDRQTKAQTAFDKAKEEMTEIQKELLAEINLESQNEAIDLQMDKIEKLKKKAVGASIKAPVDGIVTTINKAAGEKTQPDEALAVMQVTGKGFTLSFSATTEQAKKLSLGDMAELQNAWYYEDVKATLTSVKPDKTDPAQKKLLTFKVEGDVQAGQSLSLSVGQKSMNYELVVPNSAIREDNNGKFILIVESRNSPLGNRYVATRVDVEVLAADDTHTAISAGLYGYEYVITTSTKPVEAGKQVRLTD